MFLVVQELLEILLLYDMDFNRTYDVTHLMTPHLPTSLGDYDIAYFNPLTACIANCCKTLGNSDYCGRLRKRINMRVAVELHFAVPSKNEMMDIYMQPNMHSADTITTVSDGKELAQPSLTP